MGSRPMGRLFIRLTWGEPHILLYRHVTKTQLSANCGISYSKSLLKSGITRNAYKNSDGLFFLECNISTMDLEATLK